MTLASEDAPPERPISLCTAAGEKHAFRYIRTRVVVERPLHDPGPVPPDLIVFQAGQNLDFARAAGELPDALWAAARTGRGKVVFDASTEGKPHEPGHSDVLHAMLRGVGVPLEHGVYVTQDRQYARDYADHCRAAGVSRGMGIVVYDYWIRRVLSEYESTGAEVLQTRLDRFRRRRDQRRRRFLSLNFTPRPARLMFLTRLLREDLWDLGFVSFGGFDQMMRRKGRPFEKIRRDFLESPGFEAQAETLEPQLQELARRGRMVLGDLPKGNPYRTIIRPDDLAEYDESWFSVVTETEMLDRRSRITEKALKPLLNFHPFVLFGSPKSLELIRELGFVTFPELADESYDDEVRPPLRFELAFAQVARLCRMDESRLARLSGALDEKLEFNAEWGLTRLPRKYVEELDEALLKDVLRAR